MMQWWIKAFDAASAAGFRASRPTTALGLSRSEMTDKPLSLYYAMTEKFSDHLSTSGAYPEKFVLSPVLHDEYLRDVTLVGQAVGKDIDPTTHMGIRIEVDENSPGVMVAADGTEVSLQ